VLQNGHHRHALLAREILHALDRRIADAARRTVGNEENAILYRMNAQSNALEYAFKRNGVPYQVVGYCRCRAADC